MDLEQAAIERLRMAADFSKKIYGKQLAVMTSGGKDSGVIVELARHAGIEYEVQHNLTTADAPETVYFLRQEFARLEAAGVKCGINYPVYKGKRVSMWTLIPQKLMPPTRVMRYCCAILKERSGGGSFIATGVRWDESVRRKATRGVLEVTGNTAKEVIILTNDNDERRREFETCRLKAKRVVNPIIDWTERDVWDFLDAYHVPINPLYGCGFSRVGCVGCPMAGKKRIKEFATWPKYEQLYIAAFDRMLKERWRRGKMNGSWNMGATGRDVFHWWMEDGVIPGQMELTDYTDPETDYMEE